MYRSLVLVILLVLLSTPHIKAKPLTLFVLSEQAGPFQIAEENGSHSGIVVDIVRKIALETGVEIRLRAVPFRRMIRDMSDPKLSPWVNYGSPAWQDGSENEIQSQILSKTEILKVRHVLIMPANSTLQKIKRSDLLGKTLVMMAYFNYPGLTKDIANGRITNFPVNNHHIGFKMVQAQRVMGMVEMRSRALYQMHANKFDRTKFRLVDMSAIIAPYGIHLSYSPGTSEKFRDRADRLLKKFKQNGQLKNIIDRYLQTPAVNRP